MPLKFLLAIKAKHDKLRNRSKSTTDLLQGQTQLSTQSAQMIPTESGLKKKSQSKPYLRYSRKEAETLRKVMELKDNSCTDLRETKTSESQNGSPDLRISNAQRSYEDKCDHNGNTLAVPQIRTSRSASCFSVVEEASRDRRLSDIALLDQYIGYHQRRGTEDGINTKRLVCAQLLRESFLRLEQRHLNDMIRSNSKHDLSRSMSNLNQVPTNISKPPQYQKHNHRRLSSVAALPQHYEPRLSVCSPDTRKSWTSLYVPDKDDDGPIQFSCNGNSDNDFTENHRDIRGRRSSTDFNLKDIFKKPKSMTKRRSVPNFTKQEIEIF